MSFQIIRQDIVQMKVDAIVNAANTELAMGGGVCGAIFKAAGAKELQNACNRMGSMKTGQAVLTPGFHLPCKYIIHAAGPVYHQDKAELCKSQLYSAYTESLKLAKQSACESIAFPLISSGIYGYPKKEALEVAVSAIRTFLEDNEMSVYLIVFDKSAFSVSEQLLGSVESYIDEHYVSEHQEHRRQLLDMEKQSLYDEAILLNEAPMEADDEDFASAKGIDDLVGNLDEPFNTTLLRLIDAKGKTDAQVYKRANIDRKLFSKIRIGKGYLPSKRTVIALAIALELSLDEAKDLLNRAGYSISHSQKFDVMIEYFIVSRQFDIFEINEILFKYDQPLLGA
ncbi:MAG: macro domain-containing protein [Clostridia bacterium]